MKSKLTQFRTVEHLPLRQILQKMHISDEELLTLLKVWKSQGLIENSGALYQQLELSVKRRKNREKHEAHEMMFEEYKLMRRNGQSTDEIAVSLGKSPERVIRLNQRWYKELAETGLSDGQIAEEMLLPDAELIPISKALEEKKRQSRASARKKKTSNAIYSSFHMPKLRRELDNPEDYLIFDLEGIQNPDELIEIAVINLRGDVIMDTLVRPTHKINWRIAELTGITDRMAARGQNIRTVMKTLKAVTNGKTMMSWGTDYDKVLLQKAILSTGINLNCNFACAQKIHMGNAGLSRQIALHKALGEEDQSHRALDDCKMVLEVLREDLRIGAEEEEQE
ncbi:MAG: 3'-5' exonuclease [Eubacteriaceae bacterium]|jgi:DNA polymerase-3 subunit epsilon